MRVSALLVARELDSIAASLAGRCHECVEKKGAHAVSAVRIADVHRLDLGAATPAMLQVPERHELGDADDLAIQRRNKDIAALGLDDLAERVLDVTRNSRGMRRSRQRSSSDQLEDQWPCRRVRANEHVHRAGARQYNDRLTLNEITVRPIGRVRSQRSSAEDDHWDSVATSIELDAEAVEPTATLGLETFSHIEVVYVFHLVDEANVCRGGPPPPRTGRLAAHRDPGPASQGPPEPDRRDDLPLDAVDGLTVRVTGLDVIDGTPVLDIKPAMSGFAPRGEMREPEWAKELMEGYW